MFARDRIVFAELKFFGGCAGVFLRDVEKARIGRADQLDEDSAWLGHLIVPLAEKKRNVLRGRKIQGQTRLSRESNTKLLAIT